MTAPRRTRSLLRQPCHGPWGRLTTPHGPGRTSVRRQRPRPRPRARFGAPRGGQRQLAGARFGRCDLAGRAVDMAKALAVCGIGAAALWCGSAPALADTTPPPTTTAPDAPPPDPYSPPVRSVKPKPIAPARAYTPPASIVPRPAARSSRPQQPARVVRHHHKQPVRQPAKAPSVSSWLAPLPGVVAAARLPLPVADVRTRPYLWLAGIAFAVLAVAGLSLHMLSMRYLDLGFE
jgi:hypothetical protein